MRANKLIAERLEISRRKADSLIESGAVAINGQPIINGQDISDSQLLTVNGQLLPLKPSELTISLNKPVGYVCSRNGQGSNTIYDILPKKYSNLNPIGRLDKDSSGLLVLTNNGQLHQKLSHPSYEKQKIYQAKLNKPLNPEDRTAIKQGIDIGDGISKLSLALLQSDGSKWTISMHEGRNRQIRRTFERLGYKVVSLHRTKFGPFNIGNLQPGHVKVCSPATRSEII